MRVLVLGGTRFVGPHVVHQLISHGHDVTIFHRGETEIDFPPAVHHVHGNFNSFNDHVAELCATSPDVVLDMLPLRQEDSARVKAFKGVTKRVVVLGSQDVYRAFGRVWRTEPGSPDPVPLMEDSPLREELSRAGLEYNKTAIEHSIMNDADLSPTILRLPATHGPGDYQHRIFRYLKRMDDGRPAILLEESHANWHWARGYVEDVAYAVMLGVTDARAAGRIYNVAYENTFTERGWVQLIGQAVGWKGQVVALPNEQLPPPLRHAFDLTQQFVVDSTRIRKELDYCEVVQFDEALRRTIEWERANPPANVDTNDFNYDAEDAVLSGI